MKKKRCKLDRRFDECVLLPKRPRALDRRCKDRRRGQRAKVQRVLNPSEPYFTYLGNGTFRPAIEP